MLLLTIKQTMGQMLIPEFSADYGLAAVLAWRRLGTEFGIKCENTFPNGVSAVI
jgi:hypothetical protein